MEEWFLSRRHSPIVDRHEYLFSVLRHEVPGREVETLGLAPFIPIIDANVPLPILQLLNSCNS
jgi:hypothetical protein